MDKSNDDEEEDLYSDLPNFKYDEAIDKLQENNKHLKVHVIHLEEVVKKQSKEIEEYRSQCATLTKNISSLLKTAQNEIKRKDQKINELNKSVLELKTEVLVSRKRRAIGVVDSVQQPCNEQPLNKRQKLEIGSSKSDDLSLCLNLVKTADEKGLEINKPDLPQNLVTPDIKCHTLYSQRMYNKIYNVDIKNMSKHPSNNVDGICSDEREKENLSLEKTTLEDNTPRVAMENSFELSSNNIHHESLNLKNKVLIHNSINDHEKPKNANTIDSNLIFSSFFKANKHLVSSTKNDSDCNTKETEKASSTCWTDSTEIEKEVVECSNKILSLIEEKLAINSKTNEVIETNKCVKEEKRVFISRNDRSINFSKNGNMSEAVHLKPHSNSSNVHSSGISDRKISNKCNSESLSLINSIFCKNQEENLKLNSFDKSHTEETVKKQIPKSRCLRKTKKPVKNIICPVSAGWAKMNKTSTPKKLNKVESSEENKPNNKNEKSDILEALFGSPLKWTENSVDDVKQITKLSPPATAFEDSCSAHIENVKFKKIENNTADVSYSKQNELTLSKKIGYTERKCSFQPSSLETSSMLPSFHGSNKPVVTSLQEISKQASIHWPFKKTSNDIPSKTRTTSNVIFSSFVNTESTSEACDVPSSLKGSNPNNVDMKLLTSPKYNDSVLGQFDDTTQLINALAKDPSKLSPIHTPIKETKLDNTSPKALNVLDSKTVFTEVNPKVDKTLLSKSPPAVPVDQKSPVSLGSSIDKVISTAISEISSTCKRPTVSKTLIGSKVSMSKMTSSSTDKKISIPASVISTVQKKLSVPSPVLSPVEKNIRKKTILLDKPINILCPRKTPRLIGRNKNNIQPVVVNNANLSVQNEIKSPSSINEQNANIISCSMVESNSNNIKNDGVVTSLRKTCHVTSSSEERSRSSKSPLNVLRKSRESLKDEKAIRISKDTIKGVAMVPSFRKEHLSLEEKNHHHSSRKENILRRKDHRSHSRKENSPSRIRRDKWNHRDSKQDLFKRPELRRESFRRPNCHFRQSSVERRISKHWRFSRSTPIRTVKPCESFLISSRLYNDKKFESNERKTVTTPSKSPVISRSSKISWSASTGVVSTKSPSIQEVNDLNRNPTHPIKWVLRPIDFEKSSINNPKSKDLKPDENVDAPFNSKPETEVVDKPSPLRDPGSSPGKPTNIIIVAERRPIKFGSNN